MKTENDTTKPKDEIQQERCGASISSALLAIMEDEFAHTMAAYEGLLDQCRKLADAMGYNDDHVIGKVMPKTAGDRTNTTRIEEWFSDAKGEALNYRMELEAERETERAREQLLASLKLTPDQMALLGLANV